LKQPIDVVTMGHHSENIAFYRLQGTYKISPGILSTTVELPMHFPKNDAPDPQETKSPIPSSGIELPEVKLRSQLSNISSGFVNRK
jgi:hypothetical protein